MINNMSKEELELLSYGDLTELILKEENNNLDTLTLFKRICNLIDTDEDRIGEYYTALSTDKRFVLLDNAWGLRENNPVEFFYDDEDDEEIEEETEEEENEEYEEEIDDIVEDEEIDDDEELDDLAILSEEELEEK